MRILFDVSGVETNNITFAIVAAYVRKGNPLPDLYVDATVSDRVNKYLTEKFPEVNWRFYAELSNPYAEMNAWLTRGLEFDRTQGGLALRTSAKIVSAFSKWLLRVIRLLERRWSRNISLPALYDAYLTVYRPIPVVIRKSGLKVISVLPNPAAMKFPQKFLNDAKYDWVRTRFKTLTAHDIVIPAFDTCKEDMLVYGPCLDPENVIEVARPGTDLDMWANGVVNMASMGRSYYINNWHNNAPRPELERFLLVGDIAVMRFRDCLAREYNVPVDGFSTSLQLSDARFASQLKTFLYSHPYKYVRAVFMVGNHIALKPAVDAHILRQLKELVGCEILLASPLPFYMQEKKYIGVITEVEVNRQRDYMAMLAAQLEWRFIDVYQYVLETAHSKESIEFCRGCSHIGMSHTLRRPNETNAKEIMADATSLLGMALDIKKMEGESQRQTYETMLKNGEIAADESRLEFDEWETMTISDNVHCNYFFVGGCLLRDCCAASVKLKSRPSAEVYTTSHSIADPAYIKGLKCMLDNKSYDVAYFNFGAHFFLHTHEEFTRAFRSILSILKEHARKVVLLTLPELVSTCEADREECAFKDEKIRWANNQLMTVYSKEFPVVPVHEIALKYANKRIDNFHFERSVYYSIFRDVQKQIGEPAE